MQRSFLLLATIGLVGLTVGTWGHAEETAAQKKRRAVPAEAKVSLEKGDKKVTVKFGESLFTELDFANYARPILYPVVGPGNTPMTRNFPMKKGVTGEATDHPHHKSIWCGHGDINGVSFWHEEGKIVVDPKSLTAKVAKSGRSGAVSFRATYLGPEGETVCTDETTITFRRLGRSHAIDWDTTIHASHGKLVFGDTKEGMMAIRTHPSLRVDNNEKAGVTTANAKATNSEGGEGGGIWGKRAAWVDYSAKVDGKKVGVAIFDHPKNLRHPTTWHARTYGLVAANPFGLSHFEGKEKGTGNHTVEEGGTFRFRYRLVFHPGTAKSARVSKLFERYAKTK